MTTALSNLLALLALDNSAYLDGLVSSKSATDTFANKLSNVGGAVVVGALSIAATAITTVGIAAWEAGNTMNDAMDTIATATGATGPALEGLREDFEAVFASVPTDAASAADAIGILNSRLDLSGPALQNLASPLLEVSRLMKGDLKTNAELFTRVMGDWNLPVENASTSLDALFVAAQETGAPLDQLMQQVVQYGAPMRNFGFSFEQSAGLLASFAAQGVNTEIVMAGLRIAQGKFIKDGKDMNTGLWESVDAIQNAASGTDALAIATEIFGAKAAGDMVDTIRAGKFGLDQLVDSMMNADGAILETAASTADWGEKWTVFKNKMTVALAPIGEKMMGGLGKAMDSVVEIFNRPDVQTGLTKLTEMIGTFVTTAAEKIPVLIEGFLSFVTFLQNNQGIVVAVLAVLGVAAVAWGVVTAAAAWSAMAPLLPVIAVILLIAAAAYLLYQAWTTNFGGIQEKTAVVWQAIKDAFAVGVEFVKGIWQSLQPVIEFVMNYIKTIVAAWQAAFSGDWYTFGQKMRAAWDMLWNAIVTVLQTAWTRLKTTISNLITNIINFFKTTDWGQVGRNILQGIANGIKNSISLITTAANNAANAALEAAKGFLGIKSPSSVFEMQVGWQMAAGAAAGWEQGLQRLFMPAQLQPATIDAPTRDFRVAAETAGGAGSRDPMLEVLERIAKKEIDYVKLARAMRDEIMKRGQ